MATADLCRGQESARFDRAVARLSPTQIARIWGGAAQEFAGSEPKGLLSEMRFDVALVNERGGELRILENAYA